MVKQLTGAQVMAMAEDVPALQAMKPGGKEHPIDKILHDGESVTLGGTTLVAHLTPGHTRGCTTWTLKAQEGGRSYDVVIIGSFGTNPGFKLVNNRTCPASPTSSRGRSRSRGRCRATCRSARIRACTTCDRSTRSSAAGGPNPFIDPDGYKLEVDIDEAMFRAVLAEQQKAANP